MRRENKYSKTASLLKESIYQKKMLLFILGIILIVTTVINSLIFPHLLSNVVSALFSKDTTLLKRFIFLFIFCVVINLLLSFINSITNYYFQKDVNLYFENKILNFYKNLKFWGNSKQLLEVQSILGKNIQGCPSSYIGFIMGCMSLILTVISSIIYAVKINVLILIPCILMFLIIILCSKTSFEKISKYQERLTKLDNKLYQREWQYITNNEIGRFLNQEKLYKGYDTDTEEYINIMLKLRRIQKRYEVFHISSNILVVLIVVFAGTVLSIYGKTNLKEIYALTLILPNISNSFFMIPMSFVDYKKITGSLKEIEKFLNLEVYDSSSKKSFDESIKSLSVKINDFSYANSEKIVLKNADFFIDKPEMIYLVGKSGCGKSTLLKVIAQLIAGNSSVKNIKLNNENIDNFDRTSLWSKIGYLSQEPFVISGSILDNITVQHNTINEEKLMNAIKIANLNTFIEKQDLGFDTVIDQNSISSGELQKVCLSRILYSDYDLLLLDEAFSAVDPSTAEKIDFSLKNYAKENSMIILNIVHNCSIIDDDDKVIFIDSDSTAHGICKHLVLKTENEEYKQYIDLDFNSVNGGNAL